jgi:predicted nucleic acid-binding Zn ribbon protein
MAAMDDQATPAPRRRPRPTAQPDPANPTAAAGPDKPDSGGAAPQRGADLARDALAAAREKNAARRKAAGRTPMAARGNAAGLRRRRWSGSGPDARDPQPLSATLRTWVATAGTGADLKKATLFGRWEKIVGPEVADHCAPVSLVDGELVVEAESTAWATQIRMLAPQIVRRINAEVGDRTVLRIRARGPAGPSWKFGYRHVPGRGPRDTYG